MRYAIWLVDDNRLTCDDCELIAEQRGVSISCEDCTKVPRLNPTNVDVIEIYDLLKNEHVGEPFSKRIRLNFEAIRFVFDIRRVTNREDMLRKLVTFHQALIKAKFKDKQSKETNDNSRQ
ncbi:MAG TPA: hypothetical protein PKL48_03960 [Thermodesulfobacteriota bacterium]|nr:hypothetical protein [Thermodesulfobacteriota bacterium]